MPGKVNINSSDPSMWAPKLPYRAVAFDKLHSELIGDDESDAPEDAGEAGPDEVVRMGPDPDGMSPGPSTEPTFSNVTGPEAQNLPSPLAGPPATQQAVARFQARIRRRDPAAIRALLELQKRATISPAAADALIALKKKSNRTMHYVPGRGWLFAGNAIPDSLVTNTISKILDLALTPVAWATQGTGTIVTEVGTILQNLSKKL